MLAATSAVMPRSIGVRRPRWAGRRSICAILASGKNVVSTALTALLGLSLSQAWAFGSSCALVARLMLNLATTAITWGSSCTLELIPADPISFVGSNWSAANNVSIPGGHAAGDLVGIELDRRRHAHRECLMFDGCHHPTSWQVCRA